MSIRFLVFMEALFIVMMVSSLMISLQYFVSNIIGVTLVPQNVGESIGQMFLYALMYLLIMWRKYHLINFSEKESSNAK